MVAIAPTKIYEPSPVAKYAYNAIISRTAKIIAMEGAVRSSKSYTSDMAFLSMLMHKPRRNVLVSGFTSGSVAKNVIAEWKQRLGAWRFKNHKVDKDEYMTIDYKGLSQHKFYIRGGGKESDYRQIQGATFGDWYGDEITNHTKSFIDMALSRLSLEGAQAVWTMNPDGPKHFVKVDYLESHEMLKTNDKGFSVLKVIHFDLDDNPSLSQEYKDGLKASYSGVFYDRYILGKWVKAEGLIYSMFDDNIHVVDKTPTRFDKVRVAVDHGTQNATVFLLCGEVKGKTYIIDEYSHCGREEGQKTNAQYAKEMAKFFKTNGLTKKIKIIVDPAAADFKLELRNNGFTVVNAKNNVLDGIRKVSSLLNQGLLFIHKRCTGLIDEFAMYSWDTKLTDKGKDQPLKEFDHRMDALRYFVMTKIGGMR